MCDSTVCSIKLTDLNLGRSNKHRTVFKAHTIPPKNLNNENHGE